MPADPRTVEQNRRLRRLSVESFLDNAAESVAERKLQKSSTPYEKGFHGAHRQIQTRYHSKFGYVACGEEGWHEAVSLSEHDPEWDHLGMCSITPEMGKEKVTQFQRHTDVTTENAHVARESTDDFRKFASHDNLSITGDDYQSSAKDLASLKKRTSLPCQFSTKDVTGLGVAESRAHHVSKNLYG